MRIVLVIMAGLAVVVAIWILASAQTVFHEMGAVMTFGIAAVLFVGGAVCDVISQPRRLHLAREKRAPWQERERQLREQRARPPVVADHGAMGDDEREPPAGWRL